MAWWWLSTERMTVGVDVDQHGHITVGPPIVRKFIGQPIDNLRRWMSRQPGYIERYFPGS